MAGGLRYNRKKWKDRGEWINTEVGTIFLKEQVLLKILVNYHVKKDMVYVGLRKWIYLPEKNHFFPTRAGFNVKLEKLDEFLELVQKAIKMAKTRRS